MVETARQHILEEYEVVDTTSEAGFERLVWMAARILEAPVALLSFLDEDRCRIKAAIGTALDEVPSAQSLVERVVRAGETQVVVDPETPFAEETAMEGEARPRLYVGVPLVVEAAQHAGQPVAVGALCVMDTEPHAPDAEAMQMIEALAVMAADKLELRRTRNQQEMILEGITDAFFALDHRWRFTYLNDRAEELLQRARQELLGQNVWDEFPEAVGSTFHEQYRKARQEQTTVGFEAYYEPLETWFKVKAYPLERGLVVYFDDVTARKEAQRALRERERYLSVTLNSIGDAVITTDPDGCITRMNAVAEALTGWSQEAAAGRPLTDVFRIVDTRTGEPAESPVEEVLRQGHVVGLTNHTALIARDGTRHQIADSAAPIQTEDGDVLGVVLVFRDVTEEYERREALRRSKLAMEEAQQLARTGNAEFDVATNQFELSDEAARILGLEPDTAYPLDTFLDLIHPEDRPHMQKGIERAIETGEPFSIEYRVEPADRDEERWIRGRARALREEGGRVTGLFGVITDITEQKRQASLVQRFGRLLDASVNEIYLFEKDLLRFIQVSEGGRENLGYTMDELRTMTPLDLKPFDRERFEEILRPLREGTREQVVFESTHRRKDGTTYPVEVRVQLSRQETPPVFIAVILDITERRSTEQALEQSLQRNRQILQTTMDGYLLHDMEGNIIDVNPAYADMVGYSPDELVQMTVNDLVAHRSDEEISQRMQRIPQVGHLRFETQHRHKDGHVVDVEVSLGFMEEGDRRLINVFLRDITARKAAEKALQQSEARYRTLVEQSHDAIYIYRDNRLLFVNQRTCELTGYSEDELLTMDVFKLVHPDDREKVRRIARQRVEGTAPSRYEARLVRSDGTVRYGDFSVQAITYQGAYAAIGSIRDVTERKRIEHMLRRRETKVQALYEAMGALTLAQTQELVAERLQALIVDTLHYPISAIRYLEDGALALAAISPKCREVMPEHVAYEVDGESIVAAAFREGEAAIYDDVRAIATDRERGAVRAAAYVPIGPYGIISIGSTEQAGIDRFDVKLIEILARNAESVLERIEREEALRDARDEAEEMNRLKSAFLANMSHEIRTPLTSIIGFAEVLGEQGLENGAEFTRLIRRGGQRLLETLDSVLDLSQLEAGSVQLTPGRIDVAAEVRETAALFRPQAHDKEVVLTVTVPNEAVEACIDATALRRILSNLLSNAIKFTRPGDRIEVRLKPGDHRFLLDVEDTGVGIDEAFLPQLFEAFKQESTGNARAFEGSGLGLAITHQLVHLMDGDIRVESEKGEGTRFTVALPYDMTTEKEELESRG